MLTRNVTLLFQSMSQYTVTGGLAVVMPAPMAMREIPTQTV